MRRLRTLALAGGLVLALGGLLVPSGSAAFSRTTAIGPNTLTVDTLANYFAVTPGSAVRPGTSVPIATGNVTSLALAFGTVPSAQTFTGVFTVQNISGTTRTASLASVGVNQVASVVFASSGSSTVTLASGASASVSVTTSAANGGHGSGALRLGVTGLSWMYRDYPLTIDEAPEAPTAVAAAAIAAGRVTLSWTPSTTLSVVGYDVFRSTGGAYTKLNGAPVVGTAYTDAATVDGTTYTYRLQAVTASPALASLDSATATAKADATPPTQPTAVALANGLGTGNAYVNAANRSSVSVRVTLPASALASDTVTVTISLGGSTATKTAATPAGGGAVTLTAFNLSGFPDGTLILSATSTDAAGNVSPIHSATAPKDTVAPGAPTATYVDNKKPTGDDITGTAEAGATVTANPGAFVATALSGGSYTISLPSVKNVSGTYFVTATDAAGNTSAATTLNYTDTT
jgi:large repetitive protein